MHIGNSNQFIEYAMNGFKVSKINHEKDLEETISNDLKSAKHCSDFVKKANRLVDFNGRTFEFKSEKKLSLHYIMHSYAPF